MFSAAFLFTIKINCVIVRSIIIKGVVDRLDLDMMLSVVSVMVAFVFTVSLYFRVKGLILIETYKKEVDRVDEDAVNLFGDVSPTRLGWSRLIFDLSIEVLSLGIVMCVFSLVTTVSSYYALALLFMAMSSYKGFKTYVKCKREARGLPEDITM